MLLLGRPNALRWLVSGFIFGFMGSMVGAWVLLIETGRWPGLIDEIEVRSPPNNRAGSFLHVGAALLHKQLASCHAPHRVYKTGPSTER
jgi:hypothetical protein